MRAAGSITDRLYIASLRLGLWAPAEVVAPLRYHLLSDDELLRRRRSDTVFIFGSGYSINDLSPEEWSRFEEHDTFGFNFFWHQSNVRVDFHLVREMSETDRDRGIARARVEEYCNGMATNPGYADTVLLVQRGRNATGANSAIGRGLFPRRNPMYRWRSRDGVRDMSTSLESGLTHLAGALSECVNFAVLLGWTRIVLVGVDLYDRRYFWLGPDETADHDSFRGAEWTDVHRTAREGGIVELLGDWADELEPRGVELFAYNPRSLLTQRLPVYEALEKAVR